MKTCFSISPVLKASLIGTLILTGCQPQTTSISYLAVNHTDKEIEAVFVNGEGGVLNVPAKGGGGGQICCVILPRKWRPGLTATIKWEPLSQYKRDTRGALVMQDGAPVVIRSPYKEKTVEIPEYTEKDLGHFDIHFLPNDEVLVKVSFNYPEHPDYVPADPEEKKR